MAYELPAPPVKIDPFTLKMLTDVLKEHAEVTDHESGFCCQVAAQYKVRVDAHNALVAQEKAALKTSPESVERPLTEPMARYIVSLYRKCPSHLLAPVMRQEAERVVKHEEIPFDSAKILIDAMKSVVDGPERKAPEGERYATAPMVGYLKKLLASREHSEKVDITALELLPFQAASDMITRLKQAPYKAEGPNAKKAAYIPEEGLYEVDGVVYKVQKAKANGSGHVYAKVMDKETGHFEYVGRRPFELLTADNKMSREQAGTYGKLYGRCIRCGRDLTDEFSIENGLGKICYSKMGG